MVQNKKTISSLFSIYNEIKIPTILMATMLTSSLASHLVERPSCSSSYQDSISCIMRLVALLMKINLEHKFLRIHLFETLKVSLERFISLAFLESSLGGLLIIRKIKLQIKIFIVFQEL
jgi:hypothetical protein